MQALVPTTELDAINIMLGTIGESPVSSLSGAEVAADVAMASAILREVSIQVQEESWNFNTEVNWTLPIAVGTGEIALPANCIQVDTSGVSRSVDVTVRGGRLYDRTNKTFVFASSQNVDMVILLPFDDCPQAYKHYVSIRAARVFQQRMIGSETLAGFSEKDEIRARSALRKFDANTADYNILSGSWSVSRVLDR